ncbi:MAG: hypothetical protein U0992_23810 [Planctomycetaceae bacterium]
MREVAQVEHGGPRVQRDERLVVARKLAYNDLAADRQVVAAIQALEAILAEAVQDARIAWFVSTMRMATGRVFPRRQRTPECSTPAACKR